jgi:hypothetical protein
MKNLLLMIATVVFSFSIFAADTKNVSAPLSAPDALYKAIQLDNQIKEKKVAIEKEKQKKFVLLDAELKSETDKLNKLKKDEFETTNEFNARIEKLRVDLTKTIDDKKNDYMKNVYDVEKGKNLTALEKELDDLLNTKYDLTKTYYNFTIGKYNADENYFEIKFSYYLRTDIVDQKKKFVWENAPDLRWEIEREKAKELNPIKANLIMNVKASVFKLDNKFVLDKYEITIVDPRQNDVLYNYIVYKEKKIKALFIPKVDTITNEKIFIPTIPNLRLRDQEKTGNVIRLLKENEKLKIVEMGQDDEINGIKGSWVKIKSLDGNEEGWCFNGYLKESVK